MTHNGSPRALDVDELAWRADEMFGPERVVRADTLPDAIETATAIVEDAAADAEGFSGAGIVITGSVVTAGVARTLFGKDPHDRAPAPGAQCSGPLEELPRRHGRHPHPGDHRGAARAAGGGDGRRRPDHRDRWPTCSGFAVLLAVLAGMQGRSWAIWVNLAAQLLLVAGYLVYPALGFMGVLFLVVWAVIAYLRGEVLRRQRLGLLPGQQPPRN